MTRISHPSPAGLTRASVSLLTLHAEAAAVGEGRLLGSSPAMTLGGEAKPSQAPLRLHREAARSLLTAIQNSTRDGQAQDELS